MDSRSKQSPRPSLSEELWKQLLHGEMRDCRLVPRGSNYTFYAVISDGLQKECPVVYKPRNGEAPLWDFPDGTLYLREYAAYILSEALGWRFVPPTIVRGGVHGVGSVQLYIEAEPEANYFTLRDRFQEEMLRLCAFDVIANNADRKAGHCLLGNDGYIWAIDHGITFNMEYKLRTVIWDFAGEPVPDGILKDLARLLERFEEPGGLCEQLRLLLTEREVEAFRHRVKGLVERPVFPLPGPHRPIPWPWL